MKVLVVIGSTADGIFDGPRVFASRAALDAWMGPAVGDPVVYAELGGMCDGASFHLLRDDVDPKTFDPGGGWGHWAVGDVDVVEEEGIDTTVLRFIADPSKWQRKGG